MLSNLEVLWAGFILRDLEVVVALIRLVFLAPPHFGGMMISMMQWILWWLTYGGNDNKLADYNCRRLDLYSLKWWRGMKTDKNVLFFIVFGQGRDCNYISPALGTRWGRNQNEINCLWTRWSNYEMVRIGLNIHGAYMERSKTSYERIWTNYERVWTAWKRCLHDLNGHLYPTWTWYERTADGIGTRWTYSASYFRHY